VPRATRRQLLLGEQQAPRTRGLIRRQADSLVYLAIGRNAVTTATERRRLGRMIGAITLVVQVTVSNEDFFEYPILLIQIYERYFSFYLGFPGSARAYLYSFIRYHLRRTPRPPLSETAPSLINWMPLVVSALINFISESTLLRITPSEDSIR